MPEQETYKLEPYWRLPEENTTRAYIQETRKAFTLCTRVVNTCATNARWFRSIAT
jgi:hypothetical protein